MMSPMSYTKPILSKKSAAFVAILGILLLTIPGASHAVEPADNFAYVGDSVDISMRSGPENNFRIIRMLKSGMKLRVLEKNGNGWSRAVDENQKEGWILSRYLTEKMPASLRVAQLEQTMITVQEERDSLEQKFNELKKSNQTLSQDRAELDRLRSLMQNTLKVDADNKHLKIKTDQLNAELMRALDDKRILERQSDASFFVSGATVLGLGIIAGFILAKKRRSPYNSL